MRSFSLVLLRRLLFRTAPPSQSSPHPPATRLTLYDHLSSQTLTTLERLLLHSLSHEPSTLVRKKSVDTICDLANQGMARGRPWHALQAQTFSMTQATEAVGLRESAYRVFAGCPNLVMDLQTDAVLGVFQRGLQDGYSIEVSALFPYSTSRHNDQHCIGTTCSPPRICILPLLNGPRPAFPFPLPNVSNARHPPITSAIPLILLCKLPPPIHLPLNTNTALLNSPTALCAPLTCTADLPTRTNTSCRRLWTYTHRRATIP